jgi:gliding motility-associated-like protein
MGMLHKLQHIILSLALVHLGRCAIAQPQWIENRGQWPEPVVFQTALSSGVLWTERTGFTYQLFDPAGLQQMIAQHGANSDEILQGHTYRIEFINGNATRVSGQNKAQHYMNYYTSPDNNRHAAGCGVYENSRLHEVYPGIDAMVYSAGKSLKYDWIVAPGANPNQIQIGIEGAKCSLVQRDKGTDLVIETLFQTIVEKQPFAYQVFNGTMQEVSCRYVLHANRLSFELGDYDESLPLVIDPEVSFSSFIGSPASNWGFTACDDSQGNLIAGAVAFAPGYPTTLGAFSVTYNEALTNSFDIAISKFSADGTQLLYSTYLGGEYQETPNSVVVDSQDQIIIYGITGSPSFPVTPGAYQPNFIGGPAFTGGGFFSAQQPNGCDLYVTKFNSDGSLLASTFIGGTHNDGQNNGDQLYYNYGDVFRGEVNVDANDNIYVAAVTRSADFPVSFGTFGGGDYDGVLFKLSPSLNQILSGRFLGGSGRDACYVIEFNPSGQLVVAGGTQSIDFPLVSAGAHDVSWNGETDGYVAILDPTNLVLLAGTFVGTNEYDQVYFAQCDNSGDVYVYGQTAGDMPLTPGVYGQPGSGQFISKYSADFSGLLWNTTIGTGSGEIDISPTAFLVSNCEQIYISGWGGDVNNNNCFAQPGYCYAQESTTMGLPLSADAFQSSTDGSDFYLCVLTPDAQDILYGSYLGGSISNEHVDGGTSRFDKNGSVYHAVCAGCQNNDDFPTTPGAWSDSNESTGCNLAVFRFDLNAIQAEVEVDGPAEVCVGEPIEFLNSTEGATNFLWNFGDGSTSTVLQPTHAYAEGGQYEVQFVGYDNSICITADTATVEITVIPDVDPSVSGDLVLCAGESTQLTATGTDNVHWLSSPSLSPVNGLNPIATPTITTTYFVVDENECDAETLSVVVEVSDLLLETTGDTTLCLGQSAELFASGGVSYLWSPSTFLSSASSATPIATPTESIDYAVTVTDQYGCTAEETISVVVSDEVPGGNRYPDEILCEGGYLLLQANFGDTWSWFPSASVSAPMAQDPIAFPDDTTLYVVLITNACGSGFDSVMVNVIHPSLNVYGGGSICSGDTIAAWASGALSYAWSPANWASPSDEALVYLSPEDNTVFQVTGIDANNCVATANVSINVYPRAEIEAGPDAYFDYPDSIMLYGNAMGFACYWWPSEGLSCDSCEQTWASPAEPTVYHLAIVDDFGCVNDDSVFVRPYFPLFVPNAFTPNADGVNDVFQVSGQTVTGFHLTIFNRWGMKVFESFDMQTPWVGDAGSGYYAPNDVYNWVLEYDSLERRSRLEGHVVLAR